MAHDHATNAHSRSLAAAYVAASRNVMSFAKAAADAARAGMTPEVLERLARLAASGATDAQLDAAMPRLHVDVLTPAYVRVLEDVGRVEKKRQRVPTVRVNPNSIEWARERGSKMVRRISERTREALRAIVSRQIARGQRAESMVPDIRRAVGLLPREAAAVANRRALLLAQGVDEERVERLSDDYADRLLTARAIRIARTETVAAQNRGLLDTWQEAAESGALPETVVRVWVAAPESPNPNRPCELCVGELDGLEAKLGEPFQSSTLGPVMTPPAHPGCRCTMVLRRESEA